jgi:hydroxyethylthiazole kinase-like uncharacterized protein yjeF
MSAPEEVTEALLRRWPLPPIADDSDKEQRGRVLAFSGGPEVAGAVLLTGVAALRAGAGKLQVAAPRSLATPLALSFPEARVMPVAETEGGEVSPEAADQVEAALVRADAAVVGPGMLAHEAAAAFTRRLFAVDGPPLVIDAAAMSAFEDDPQAGRRRAGQLVLTPHAGEMARLSGREKSELSANRLEVAREAAQRMQAVVALKGAETMVVSPDGKAWRHHGAVAGLATGGSGDVLAGVIAGLIARGASPVQATVWGVFVHAAAGRRLAKRIGRLGYLARELLDEIAPVIAALDGA